MIKTRDTIEFHVQEAERLANYAELHDIDNADRHHITMERAQLHLNIAHVIHLINAENKTLVVRNVSTK